MSSGWHMVNWLRPAFQECEVDGRRHGWGAALTMREVWHYSKRDWFGFYLSRIPHWLGHHGTHCLGRGCFEQKHESR